VDLDRGFDQLLEMRQPGLRWGNLGSPVRRSLLRGRPLRLLHRPALDHGQSSSGDRDPKRAKRDRPLFRPDNYWL